MVRPSMEAERSPSSQGSNGSADGIRRHSSFRRRSSSRSGRLSRDGTPDADAWGRSQKERVRYIATTYAFHVVLEPLLRAAIPLVLLCIFFVGLSQSMKSVFRPFLSRCLRDYARQHSKHDYNDTTHALRVNRVQVDGIEEMRRELFAAPECSDISDFGVRHPHIESALMPATLLVFNADIALK